MAGTLRDGVAMVRGRPALLTILAIGAVYGAFSEGYDRLSTAHMLENFTFPNFAGWQPVVWLGALRIVLMLLSAVAIESVRRRVNTNNHQAVARAMFVLFAVLADGHP